MHPKQLEMFHNLHPFNRAYPYQVDWINDESKFKLGIKARQIGITTSEAVDKFITGSLWRENAQDPLPPVVIFCSPSQRQSNRLMYYIQKIKSQFERIYKTTVKPMKETETHIVFANYAEIWSLPNNPRTIEGIDGSSGIIDEAGNFQGREGHEIYSALMGSLGAKNGSMVVFGKPRGRRGILWELYDPYGEFVGTYNIHKFKWGERAKVDPQYLEAVEAQRSRLTSVGFQENYECEFVDESIVVFPYELLDAIKKDYPLWTDYWCTRTVNPIYGGCDFGRKQSQTAITLIEHSDEMNTVRYHEVSDKTYDIQLAWITHLIERTKPQKFIVDETGMGIPLLDVLKARFPGIVEGVVFTSAVKEKMIMTARTLCDQGKLTIPDHKDLIEQLHGMEKTILESGRPKYTGKRTETAWLDDRAWSLFIACSQLGEGSFEMQIVDNVKKFKTDREVWLDEDDDE